jgi:hypothetical protein
MTIKETAWHEFTRIRNMLSGVPDEKLAALGEMLDSKATETFKKEVPPQVFKNYLEWDMKQAIEGVKEAFLVLREGVESGAITVQEDGQYDGKEPVYTIRIDDPADHGDNPDPGGK